MQEQKDFEEAFKQLIGAVGQSQGFIRAQSYILHEVLCDLAKKSDDPEKYLAGMFERVSARADQGEIEKEAHPASVEFRWQVENIFKHAGNAVRPK